MSVCVSELPHPELSVLKLEISKRDVDGWMNQSINQSNSGEREKFISSENQKSKINFSRELN